MSEDRESKEHCVFCKILAGEMPVSELYRDDDVAAFMDIQPVNTGHLLVIPIEHSPGLSGVDTRVAGKMFQVAQKMGQALRHSGVPCEGVNLFVADGEVAGQEVWHCHLHVFPRVSGDGFGLKYSDRNFIFREREELDQVAGQIKDALVAL